MVHKIIMPSGGQTTDEMLIVKWYKTAGETVKTGDLLFEIETDKAAMSVESYAEGILLEIKYREGDRVKTGEVVAYIGNPGEKIPENSDTKVNEDVGKVTAAALLVKNENENGEVSQEDLRRNKVTAIITASPLARARAKSENLRIEEIANHFSKNLLKKSDVDNYLITSHISDLKGEHYIIEASPMRKTVARRMKESISTAPHYIVSVDVDMTELINVRERLNVEISSAGVKVTYNDLLMKIGAIAVSSFPIINSSFLEDKIKVFTDVNFGLAVSLENGLIVPVVRQVNKKQVREIAEINTRNINAARNNLLKEADISGGTITLSNLGMTGINNFTAIINQPESCILAIGAIQEKPVVKHHQLVIRQMMNITASFDHRIIDGSYGAAFLNRIKEIIENPASHFE